MTSFVFRETLMTHLLLWEMLMLKSSEMVRRGCGALPLMPDRMAVNRDERKEIYYLYTVDSGPQVRLSKSEVLHIPGLGFDGLVGYSPIAMAKNAIGMAIACENTEPSSLRMERIPVVFLNIQGH